MPAAGGGSPVIVETLGDEACGNLACVGWLRARDLTALEREI